MNENDGSRRHDDGSAGSVEVDSSLRFLRQHLVREASSILDVGCGNGAIAQGLLSDGHRVVGLDLSEEAVVAARARGVDAHLITWPDLETQAVDAIVFARSLHHMEDLGNALDRVRDLLVTGGVLLVDDFAWEAANTVTLVWLRDQARGLCSRGLLPENSCLLDKIFGSEDPLPGWKKEYSSLHDSIHLDSAIRRRFQVKETSQSPYLYSYLEKEMVSLHAREREAHRAFLEETRLAAANKLVLLGRRWVATRAEHRVGQT